MAILLSFQISVFGQAINVSQEATSQSVFNLLQSDEVKEITIKTDMEKLLEGKGVHKYVDARLTYTNASDKKEWWNIKVKQRGKFRKKECAFPPLKLRFSKKDLAAKGLKSFRTLKLVTHCMDDVYTTKNNVLKEYLTYKLYNELTDKSLKVQLVKVTYVDINKKYSKLKRYGILIENHHEMADRVGSEVVTIFNPDYKKVNKKEEIRMAMFQYMIKNNDWNVVMAHNIKLVKDKETGLFSIVPYDFDFAGIVNSRYETSNAIIKLESSWKKAYQGHFKDQDLVNEVISEFQSKRENFEATILNCKTMDKLNRKKMIRHLNSFYKKLEYDNIMKNAVVSTS